MNKHRGFLGIRRINKVLNGGIRELCGMTKGVDKRIDKVFSDVSAMWRESRIIELLRGSM